MTVDFLMTVLLLLQMAYHFEGDTVHLCLGITMFILFIIHNTLNFNWYKNLLKGKYSTFRIIQTIINLVIFTAMVCLIVSGIIMSRHRLALDSFIIGGSMNFARTLHLLASHWGFIFMSLHLGLHWGLIMGMVRSMAKNKKTSRNNIILVRVLVLVIAGFGVYAFIKHNIGSYLFLRNQFVFFDYEQPVLLFFLECCAMMGLFVTIGYYLIRLLQKYGGK